MSHIRSASRSARVAFAALLAALPIRALAAPPPAAAAPNSAALQAERAHLRAELDRVHAEIDALKKAAGGVGDDYRLRARMADAEALARRLIDLEARLGLRAPAAQPGPLPTAAPTDGPADLEAKADILADRSRRVRAEAEALDRRVADLKGRQALRRRAAELERDPFAPLEGSKRRVASIAGGSDSNSASQHVGGASLPGPFSPPGGAQVSTPPPKDTTSNTQVAPSASGTSQTGATTAPPPVPGALPATPLSLELRDLLDPATVAEIRRLEGARTSNGSVQALERAVAALRARAEALDGQARAMRDTAHKPR